MAIEITVYASDVRELDETITRAFDIRNGWGSKAVNDDSTMATFDELGFEFPDGSVQAVLQRQQEQINELNEHIIEMNKTVSELYSREQKQQAFIENLQEGMIKVLEQLTNNKGEK
jgi:acylphosphatase